MIDSTRVIRNEWGKLLTGFSLPDTRIRMDFRKVIQFIATSFDRRKIEYAFIGGFALGILGSMRSTMDLDLLVKKQDLPTIDEIFSAHLYRLLYRSENVSQYVAELNPLGSIDLLHAFRPRALAMLTRAQRIPVFQGCYEIPVLIAEDLIGLKVQALFNNPERKTIEQADIEILFERFHGTMDWQLVREYFELFGLQEYFETLRGKYGTPE